MNMERRRRCKKILTVLGAFLLLLPNSVFVYWGNISVYVLSYCVVVSDSTFGVEAPWIIATNFTFTILGLLAYTSARKYLGQRLVLTLSIVIIDLGFFISYLTVQTTFMALNFSLAAMIGFGSGLLKNHALRLVVEVATGDIGILTSIVLGSYYWGGCLFNFISTYFINPQNEVPALQIGQAKYFTQHNVLDKVPSLFVVLGSVSFGFHLVGSLLLTVNECLAMTGSHTKGQENELKSENACDKEGDYGSNAQAETPNEDPHGENLRPLKSEQTVDWSNGVDMTPREMLKTPSFYALALTAFMAEYPLLILFNYYKTFGLMWIGDDHFLTEIGNVMIFSNVWLRVIWGYAMDRIGCKACFVSNSILIIIISAWFYFTAMVDKWLYAIVVIVYGSLAGAFFSGMVMAMVCLYGKTHFTTNFGIMQLNSLVINLIVPLVAEAILNNLGWFYMFSSAGFANVVSLILLLFCIPLK